jgi:hypothetical protein
MRYDVVLLAAIAPSILAQKEAVVTDAACAPLELVYGTPFNIAIISYIHANGYDK